MLDLEKFFMLRDLSKERLSISEIPRRTGHGRGTVRKYLRSKVPPASKKRSKKSSKLDGYREYIISRLEEYPLSAKRIYREIQEKEFAGKYTIVKDFVREVRPKVGVPAVYRYETKPGVQSQVDWGECDRIEIDPAFRINVPIHNIFRKLAQIAEQSLQAYHSNWQSPGAFLHLSGS